MPVSAAARRAVGAYLAERGPGAPDERLLLNQADQPLTPSGITQLLRRLRRRTRVSARCNPHTFRHTLAHNYRHPATASDIPGRGDRCVSRSSTICRVTANRSSPTSAPSAVHSRA